MTEELEGRQLRVESVWVLELLVPRLVDHRQYEGSTGIVSRFIQLPVVFSRFVLFFGAIDLLSCGILVNRVIIEMNDGW